MHGQNHWLVEDIGSNTLSEPEPPKRDHLSNKGITTMVDSAHEIYLKGGDPSNPTEIVD